MFGTFSETVSVESLSRDGRPVSDCIQNYTQSYPKDIRKTFMKVFLFAGVPPDFVNIFQLN